MKTLLAGILFLFVSVSAQAKQCTYEPKGEDIEVYFIGYKFDNKTPVRGFFRHVELNSPKTTSIKQGLKKAEIKIATLSLETNNWMRNANIWKGLFENVADGEKIEAKVKSVKGNEETGLIQAEITMNGVTSVVPMSYSVEGDKLTAKGKIDILKTFKATKGFQKIAEICGPYHKGKTWSEVEIGFTLNLNKSC